MKRFVNILISLLLIISLASCRSEPKNYQYTEKRVERVYYDNTNGIGIFRDAENGVAYLWREAGYGAGLTVMLNPDGTPLIW